MRWKPLNKVCLQSDCGRYTVTKAMGPHGWVYDAWKGKAHLLMADNADACKQACEVDANG